MERLELAREEDLELCSEILQMGRAFQKEQGFTQWTEDYPNRETVREDIQVGKGYVIKIDENIAGYLCIDFDGEPAYEEIQGKWNTKGPYAVVHRMAFHSAFRGIGLSERAFRLVEGLCCARGVKNIRIDTDFPNKRMQHILEKNGFSRCGIITFQGSGKLAYDKKL